MFRRAWAGLPPDPIFPDHLQGLGYFINDVDEIRSIENEKNYFKYFEYKNTRWNDRQRFHMNTAIQGVLMERLEKQGLQKTILPLGTKDLTQPHTKILTSVDLSEKSRVVLVFGESMQDLGVLAYRVIGGRGGVDKGSMVSVVKAIKDVHKAHEPGVMLANMGQSWWWPEGKRALSHTMRHEIPMTSAVHWGRRHRDEINTIPENGDAHEHVRYIFEKVVPAMVAADAKLDIIAVGDAVDVVEKYLSETWPKWAGRLSSLANVGGYKDADELPSDDFKDFLKRRARAWTPNGFHELGTVISGPDGNPFSSSFTGQGCPVHSAGEVPHAELMLIQTHLHVLRWQAEVAATEHYENPFLEAAVHPDEVEAEKRDGEYDWPAHAAAEKAREDEEAARKAVTVTDEKPRGDKEEDGQDESVKTAWDGSMKAGTSIWRPST